MNLEKRPRNEQYEPFKIKESGPVSIVVLKTKNKIDVG